MFDRNSCRQRAMERSKNCKKVYQENVETLNWSLNFKDQEPKCQEKLLTQCCTTFIYLGDSGHLSSISLGKEQRSVNIVAVNQGTVECVIKVKDGTKLHFCTKKSIFSLKYFRVISKNASKVNKSELRTVSRDSLQHCCLNVHGSFLSFFSFIFVK